MAERLPELDDITLPMRNGEMSIRQMSNAGMDWRTILQIAYVAALQNAALYPEVGEIPDPETILQERRKEGFGDNTVYLTYDMVRLSEPPETRKLRRLQEQKDWENERRLRGEAVYYDWIP